MGIYMETGFYINQTKYYISEGNSRIYNDRYVQNMSIPEGFTIYIRGQLSSILSNSSDSTKFKKIDDGYLITSYVSSIYVTYPLTLYDNNGIIAYTNDPRTTNEKYSIYLKSGIIVDGKEVTTSGWKVFNKPIVINQ